MSPFSFPSTCQEKLATLRKHRNHHEFARRSAGVNRACGGTLMQLCVSSDQS